MSERTLTLPPEETERLLTLLQALMGYTIGRGNHDLTTEICSTLTDVYRHTTTVAA